MKKLFLFFFIFLISCSPKKVLNNKDLEEIFNFKASVVAYSSNERKNLKEFLEFKNTSARAKKEALQKCENFKIVNYNKMIKCKIKYVKFTNKIETSLN